MSAPRQTQHAQDDSSGADQSNMTPVGVASREAVRAFDSLPDLVALVEPPDMRILDVNKHGVAQLGWTQEGVIGLTIADFRDPSDAPLIPQFVDRVMAGETVYFDRRVRSASGDLRSYNFALRATDDEHAHFFVVARPQEAMSDITDIIDRRRCQRRPAQS